MADSSTRAPVGCAELPPGMSRRQYFEKLDLLEVAALHKGTVSRKAVRSWREQSPASARFTLLAPQQLTHPRGFASDAEADASAAQLAEFSKLLAAEAVVFRTPSSFTPSATGRDQVRRFFTEIASAERFPKTERVWDPDGLWEAETLLELARELDILLAVDPLAPDPFDEHAESVAQHLARGRAYLRLAGLGMARRQFDAYQLEMLCELVSELDRYWIVLAHPGKYPDALALLRELGAE